MGLVYEATPYISTITKKQCIEEISITKMPSHNLKTFAKSAELSSDAELVVEAELSSVTEQMVDAEL